MCTLAAAPSLVFIPIPKRISVNMRWYSIILVLIWVRPYCSLEPYGKLVINVLSVYGIGRVVTLGPVLLLYCQNETLLN